MSAQTEKPARDIAKEYTVKQFVSKIRRFADCIEKGEQFQIQVAGEHIVVPSDAIISIEHERNDAEEELEFQIRWKINR